MTVKASQQFLVAITDAEFMEIVPVALVLDKDAANDVATGQLEHAEEGQVVLILPVECMVKAEG